MRYGLLLPPQALARVHTAIAGHGTANVFLDVRELLIELASPRDECVVLDPVLITPAMAESLATSLAERPRTVVAYSSVTGAALESAVILAQRTSARFVFRGTPNERSALEHALLLTPDSALGPALLSILEENMNSLPSGLRGRIASMFRSGDGPYSPDALAASSALARRSLDRYLAEAGFVSATRVIETARVASAYRAIITSRTPLNHIAAMLGYKSPRTLDAQITMLLGTTGGALRTDPLCCTEAAKRLALRLTARDTPARPQSARPRRITRAGVTSLRLVSDDSHPRQRRRTVSGEQ